MPASEPREGWGWFEPPAAGSEVPTAMGEPAGELCRAFRACFSTPHGEAVLRHLRRAFLERRVGPTAPDSELRHVEGQRSVVAYVAALIERARQEDRF